MNEIEVLWQEFGHLNAWVPDTLVIREKEIRDWIYTSCVRIR